MNTQDQKILTQIIAHADGNDVLLSDLALAIQSGDPAEVQRVIARHMGVYLSEEKAREVAAHTKTMPEVVSYST